MSAIDPVASFIATLLKNPFLVIIDTEAVALIRHFTTDLIMKYIYTDQSSPYNHMYLIAIRVGVSCFAYWIYKTVTAIKDLKDEFSHFFLIIFVYVMITRIFKLGDLRFIKLKKEEKKE